MTKPSVLLHTEEGKKFFSFLSGSNRIEYTHRTASGEVVCFTVLSREDNLVEITVENLVTRAYNEFMGELFGGVPEDPTSEAVPRSLYDDVLKRTVDKYGIEDGYPVSLEWALVLMTRGPQIKEDE